MLIGQAIRSLRAAYLASGDALSEYEINSGLCEDFALDLMEALPMAANEVYTESFQHEDGRWDRALLQEQWGITPPTGMSWASLDNMHAPGHCWVVVGGLHYDAECPEGVASFFELPIFSRAIARQIKAEGKPTRGLKAADGTGPSIAHP